MKNKDVNEIYNNNNKQFYYFVLVDKYVYVLILLDKLRCKILSQNWVCMFV